MPAILLLPPPSFWTMRRLWTIVIKRQLKITKLKESRDFAAERYALNSLIRYLGAKIWFGWQRNTLY